MLLVNTYKDAYMGLVKDKSKQIIVLGECLRYIFRNFVPEIKISVITCVLKDFAVE